MSLLLILYLNNGLIGSKIVLPRTLKVLSFKEAISPFLARLRLTKKHLVALAVSRRPLALTYLQQLDFEHQSGTGWNIAAGPLLAVCVLRQQNQFRDLADRHGRDAYVPALDDLALADLEGEGGLGVLALVEHFIRREQPALVEHVHLVTVLGCRGGVVTSEVDPFDDTFVFG